MDAIGRRKRGCRGVQHGVREKKGCFGGSAGFCGSGLLNMINLMNQRRQEGVVNGRGKILPPPDPLIILLSSSVYE